MDSRRVRMTKQILRDCLLEMLQERPLSNISVRELCCHADINRSTFYIHYRDIYDLFESLEQETVDQLTRYMEQRVRRKNQEDAMTDLLTYVRRDASHLYLTLMRSSLTYADRMRDTACQVYHKYYQDIGKKFSEEDAYRVEFNTAGALTLIQKWLQTGGKQSPREMATMIFSLCQPRAKD